MGFTVRPEYAFTLESKVRLNWALMCGVAFIPSLPELMDFKLSGGTSVVVKTQKAWDCFWPTDANRLRK